MSTSVYGMLVVCALVCVLPAAWSQKVFRWKVEEYPDPFSFDTYTQCGRSNKSNICDPNTIIAKKEADEIDSLIWSVYRESRCDCQSCIRNSHGYVIRVAIMPRMESIYKHGNTSQDRLKDAQMFSYILTRNWAMTGSCNESLLILYSRYDGILYTLTLPQARHVLEDEAVKRITMQVRPLFDDETMVGRGLKELITKYKMVLMGDREGALRPKVSQQRSSNAGRLVPSFALVLLFTAFWIAVRH